jgi:hypothetical protein
MKIASSGDAVLYSTYLDGQARVCATPASAACAATVVNAVAVDDQLRATVAGLTLQPDFPVTPGALQNACRCDYGHNSLFVSRFRADGSGLEWSTFLGSYDWPAQNALNEPPAVAGLVLDAQGNATVAGTTYGSAVPRTAGAIQAAYPVTRNSGGILMGATGFLSVISKNGSSLLHSTYFGGSQRSLPRGLARDSAGNLWITGEASSADLPKPRNSTDLGSDYVAEVDSSLTKVVRYFGLPNGSAGLAINAVPEAVVATGASNAFGRLPQGERQIPSVWGVVGSAESAVSLHIAPGALVSVYGVNLGPDPSVEARLDDLGRVATDLNGYRVLVNGIPAPLLYREPTRSIS